MNNIKNLKPGDSVVFTYSCWFSDKGPVEKLLNKHCIFEKKCKSGLYLISLASDRRLKCSVAQDSIEPYKEEL